ncbi:glycoside hydrolase family 19 protein [Streptomyces violaceoruber]
MADRTPPLGVEELHALVAAGDIDTVVLAFPDMQGRLQGKRFAARFFLDEVLEHGTEGCNYLLAVDVDMNTVDDYAMSSWDRGYGDFAMRADPATLRRLPWNEGTAMAVADLAWEDGSPVLAAPRQILRRQLERLAGHGYTAQVGTELEFIVFRDTYEHAWDANYRGLVYVVEQNTANYPHYCDASQPYGCPAGNDKYYGRGPVQLSWNFNYKAAGDALGIDLLNNPDLVQNDSAVAWKTGLWYWNTQTGPGTMTPHDAMVNGAGFGETIRSINGSLECDGGNPGQVQSRIDNYERFTQLLGVEPGGNLSC